MSTENLVEIPGTGVPSAVLFYRVGTSSTFVRNTSKDMLLARHTCTKYNYDTRYSAKVVVNVDTGYEHTVLR